MSVTGYSLRFQYFPLIRRIQVFLAADCDRAAQIRFLGLSAAITLLALLGSTNGESVSFFGLRMPPLCPFKTFTGLDCPGCGITRSLIYAFHGRFHDAYMMHMWGVPLALLLFVQIPYRLSKIVLKRPAFRALPYEIKRRANHVLMLSILLPWIAKLAVLIHIRVF